MLNLKSASGGCCGPKIEGWEPDIPCDLHRLIRLDIKLATFQGGGVGWGEGGQDRTRLVGGGGLVERRAYVAKTWHCEN